jgi:hypothetical protein
MPMMTSQHATRTDTRRSRQSRLLKAEITSQRMGKFVVTVRNVSEQGIGGKAPVELNLGERVQVGLPGLTPIMGTVRWSFEGQFGIETDRAIALDALRTAFGGALPSANPPPGFTPLRPVSAPAKRPGLTSVQAPFGQATRVDDYWMR